MAHGSPKTKSVKTTHNGKQGGSPNYGAVLEGLIYHGSCSAENATADFLPTAMASDIGSATSYSSPKVSIISISRSRQMCRQLLPPPWFILACLHYQVRFLPKVVTIILFYFMFLTFQNGTPLKSKVAISTESPIVSSVSNASKFSSMLQRLAETMKNEVLSSVAHTKLIPNGTFKIRVLNPEKAVILGVVYGLLDGKIVQYFNGDCSAV
jgi:hypothetical protein